MLDTHARKFFDNIFIAIAKLFLRKNLRPNHITTASLAVGIASGVVLYFGHIIIAVVLLWVSGLFDAVDGSMARCSGKSGLGGAMFDIVSDRIVELAIFWALALHHSESLIAMLALLSTILISMTVFLTTGMLAQKESKKSFYYQAGLMERTEGLIASTVMMLFQNHLTCLTFIYAALIAITIVQRLWEAGKLLRQTQ
ncbi:MAG: CDP-alcohol phosphatidyltransferase family protein [Termitinemataceae bacterium]|nr:MAG: CDP-alcohol phosphatidyltransferase family protein [Termitinemataceae bacterium]